MDITNIIFCKSLGVTSHVKKFLTICCFQTDLVSLWMALSNRSKKIVIHSNDLGYPFGKSCHPFERLGVSVWKKLSSARTAWAICLKKVVIRSKKNLLTVRATEAICSKINFSRVSVPKPIFLLATCVEWSVILQVMYVKNTNASYMNSYASLLFCSHLRFHIINRLSTVSTFVLVNT